MKVREAIELIEQDGWFLDRIRGSHRQYKHHTKSGLVTIPPNMGDELAPGTLNSVLKQVGEAVKFLIVIEQTGTGYSAYSPDVPGCVTTGATREEVERNMHEAIEFHLEGLRQEGSAVPQPSTSSAYVEVEAS